MTKLAFKQDERVLKRVLLCLTIFWYKYAAMNLPVLILWRTGGILLAIDMMLDGIPSFFLSKIAFIWQVKWIENW